MILLLVLENIKRLQFLAIFLQYLQPFDDKSVSLLICYFICLIISNISAIEKSSISFVWFSTKSAFSYFAVIRI